jgi:uncharacterized protein YybS (DUF2232 family)
MQNNNDVRQQQINFYREVVIFALALIISGLQSAFLGWTHLLLPLFAFYFIYKYDQPTGVKIIISGFGIAFIVSLITSGSASTMVFSSMMIPVGYSLAQSAKKNHSLTTSAVNALLIMLVSWFILWLIVSSGDSNPYQNLLASLITAMEQSIKLYQTDATINADTLYTLEETLQIMKRVLPQVLPGILLSGMIVTIWLTMAIGNRLIYKTIGTKPWGDFTHWRLPEQLVWSAIIAGALYMIATDGVVGMTMIIALVVIYLFQGLSIMVFWLNKWSLPIVLRSAIYALVFLQSFGVIILAVIGISDAWFDYRKLTKPLEN